MDTLKELGAFLGGISLGFGLSIFIWVAINKTGNWVILRDLVRFALLFVIILSISYFIYPTPYHYSMYRGQYPLKINWMTGETQVFNGTKWLVINEK